jgi:YggT family protein
MKVTNWALMPLRKVIPGLFGVDLAALVLAYILEVINVVLIALLSGIHPTAIIAFVALIKLLMLILNLFFFAILLRAVASWFAPSSRHPLYELLIMFTEPVLRPIQRVIPALAGFDLSPLIALMVIQVLLIFLKGFLW